MRFNLRALEAFRQTLTTGSGSEAARQLGISQPAVSRLIARLQSDLGFELFYREHGRLVATPEALMLSDEVELALKRLDQVASVARNIGHLDIGELRIVGPPSLVEGPLSAVIAHFLNQHPNLRAIISTRDVDSIKELVATREVDCGFVRMPVNYPGLNAEVVLVSETVCVLPPDHPLAAREVITPADLRAVPLVLVGRGRQSRKIIEALFAKAKVTPHVRLEAQTVGSACAFASHGVGVAIVNGVLANDHTWRGVQLRPLRPRIPHEYAFVTAASVPMAKVTKAFLACCRNEFQAGPSSATGVPRATDSGTTPAQTGKA